jgi:hypothetical protein
MDRRKGLAPSHRRNGGQLSAAISEYLEKFTDAWLTAKAVAMIEPMRDDGYEIVKEARKLGCQKAFDPFAKHEVFSAFVALNPSLMAAITLQQMARR